MVVTVDSSGNAHLHAAGQTMGAESALRSELRKICVENPQKLTTTAKDFLGAINHFAGGPKQPWPINEKGNNAYFYTQVYMKGKSDFVYEVMSDEGLLVFLNGMQKHSGMYAIFDGYGGSVAKVAPSATAFFHRKAICSVQYVSQFSAAAADSRISAMRAFYDSLRPYVSGHSYINYPDTDLGDRYGEAYWGDNFDRLKKIKATVDPENLFHHAQSIPV
jgi:FAD/FMN-containing dehydrogenase